jgi:hypothetical protein
VWESLDSGRTGSKRVGELAAAAAVADVPDRLVEAMAGYIRAARADASALTRACAWIAASRDRGKAISLTPLRDRSAAVQ